LHLNDQNDFVCVSPPLDCLNCQKNLCHINQHIPPCQNIDPSLISAAALARLRSLQTEDVSAIVAIYQPEVQTLNRCLESLLGQVQEIVVCAEGNSVIPSNARKDPKIRYVQKNLRKIGYGRNTNNGARHSNGRYLLLINDDVFLDEGAVERMREQMQPGVAVVSNLLRYPNGQIYHAGKVRSPGVRGWGHIDHRQWHPSIKEACDMENTCGACVLVRREAFYQIGGFDEDYFIYAEDDDFMLRMRKAGWRLRYTPHSTGIHMEGQSTQKIGQPNEHIQQANQIFTIKWGAYLDHNLHRVPGSFDYLKA
jgi:GT2 family glycosyltransferase